jgi:hypothetical protein
MKQDQIIDAMNFIDDDLIERAEVVRSGKKARKPAWVKWGVMAACLCLVVVVVVHALTPGNSSKPVLEWSDGFQAADYFTYNGEDENGGSADSSFDMSVIPCAAERYFSDERDQMEADGIIPEMPDHPLFTCIAHYNEDGSLFSVTFSWHQRGEVYSDLSITAGCQEVQMIQDCIAIEVEVDEDGNIVPAAVTATERDGIQIIARGSEKQTKTLTFQNDTGWYQISGSWNDSYASVTELLNWVWAHPVNFELFDMSRGVEIINATLDEYPDTFENYIPDFDGFGYVLGENNIELKNGKPYRFEGHYYADSDEGQTEIHWCVDAEPDYYDQQESMGDLSELTEQIVRDTLARESHISFMLDDCLITVYAKDADKVWAVITDLIEE